MTVTRLSGVIRRNALGSNAAALGVLASAPASAGKQNATVNAPPAFSKSRRLVCNDKKFSAELIKFPSNTYASDFAARLIAARIRTYVAQRQIFPAIAASMSASFGLRLELNSAVALMI